MADADWLVALAGHGLAGRVGPVPLPPSASATSVVSAAARHRLLGVLAAAVADGAVSVDDERRDRVARAHSGAMREALLLEDVLLSAVEVLDRAGVDHRVVKGSALAHLVHRDPAERTFGDNDLLLAPADIDRGVAALVAAGATRSAPALSPSFDRRFAKSVTLRWHGPSELDVHRTLAAGPYGFRIDLDDLAREPVEFALAGRAVRTLALDRHLLHGAIHVALGDVEPRLGNVRDLALLAAHPAIDVDEVVARAEAWGCVAPVAIGLRSTAALGHDRTALETWADTVEIGPPDRRRLAAYTERAGRFRRQALASLRELSGADRVAFARAVLFPSAASRAARGRSRRGQLARLRGG